jgi:hypothetical protein
MFSLVRSASLLLLTAVLGCASSTESDDDGSDQSGQAQTEQRTQQEQQPAPQRSCRPFLLDMTVAGRGVGFERACSSENESTWAMIYNTTINDQPVRARYQSRGENKAKLDLAIQKMVAEGVTRPTATFLNEKVEPALVTLLGATTEDAKKAAQENVRSLFEQHLLSL